MSKHPIAFDAAKLDTGWACQASDRAWRTGVIDVSDAPEMNTLLHLARENLHVNCAAIEWPYLGTRVDDSGRTRYLVSTYAALVGAATRIMVQCERVGLPYIAVLASTWHAAYSITGPRKDCKLGAERIAKMLGAPDGLSDHEYDAIDLCDYATLNWDALIEAKQDALEGRAVGGTRRVNK